MTQGEAQGGTDTQVRGVSALRIKEAIVELGGSVATQAEMEAASSNTKFASPGTTKFHPGVCKAWVQFHHTEVIDGTSYNVASISHVGSGRHTVNFTADFSSAEYVGVGLGCDNIMGSRNNDDWTADVAHMEFRDFAGALVQIGGTTQTSVRCAFFGEAEDE